jgi:acetolactate synthase I/II/III large subunit
VELSEENMSSAGNAVRGADVLVDSLVRAGIRTIFGLPGDTGVVLYDALYGRTQDIEHVLTRDERHAVAAADAYARITNTVGAVEVSSGGGTTYAVGGLGEAYAASVPLLLITSDIHTSSRGTGALTEIDQEALFSAVTKWRTTVTSAATIPAVVAEAIRQATSGRPAPVAVIVPEDVLDELVDEAISEVPQALSPPAERSAANAESVAAAAEALASADRPAILAGSGVHVSGAHDTLRRLAEHAGLPVATSIQGKGAITDTSPWSLGVVGNNGGRNYANDYLASADVVLLVGTRANATDTNVWTGPARDGRTTVIQIDIEAGRAGRNFPGSLGLVGDADTVLGQLLAAMPAGAERSARLEQEITAARNGWRTARAGLGSAHESGTLLPSAVIEEVREVLGAQAIVVADPGTPTPNLASYWDVDEPGRTLIVPRGHGPMGYAIPAAVGAAFARPDRPILALTADGSFAMACGELETVARFGLPIIFVQFTNHSFGWIKMLQHLYTGRRYFGVDPGPIDAPRVAEASGIRGKHVRCLEDLKAAVAEAAEGLTPVYLEVEVPHMIDHSPPVSSWHDALAGNAERPVY